MFIKVFVFVGIDHLAKQEIVVVEKDEAGPSSSSRTSGLPTKPKGLFPTTKKIKSFAEYKKGKGKLWKKSVSSKNSDEDKLQVAKSKERNVCINIGLLEWNIKESILKPKRVKPLRNGKHFTLSHLYSESDDYVLLYENGEEALFLPGSTKEFFSLERYQEELGKDYNRITLFLCTSFDYNISQGIDSDSDNEDALLNCDIPDDHGTSIEPHVHPTPKRLKVDVAKNNKQEDFQIQNDEKFAIELQQQFEEEVESEINMIDEEDSIPVVEDSIRVVEDKSEETKEEFIDQASVIEHLEKKTDNSSQFFIVIRRKVPFQRVLSLWQRATKKSSPTQRLTVKYVGEDNGNFRTCGQIAAVSLAQGGPSPSLFEECVYDTLVNPDIDMMKLNIDQHLTKREKELVNKFRNDIKGNQDKILDYGYTGVIDDGHVDEIVRSIVVSLANKRVLYLKGLALYGVDELLKKAPGLCKYYFVQGFIQDNIDANYLFSCMQREYSEPGSSRRTLEQKVVDNFQDFLNSIEDTKVTGYSAPVAWNYKDEDEEKIQEEKFETAEVNVSGMMMWLTGQKHIPLNGKKLSITIYFDHDCKSRDPKHTICFPLIGACGMQITFPMEHMVDSDEFHSHLLVAYSKSQNFGKP
ncbi:Hypothetical predicted protein [Paramuricea clavata]|uniref:Uncharacterized protein n=1 Tax=Paramuricea clavata TaxID=317549 RepID=A0A6S7JLE1_PARCT|nr:Hypothetical predicted protein [Paramuricea clavata]